MLALIGPVTSDAASLSAQDTELSASVPMEAGGPIRTGEHPGPGPSGEIAVKWQQSYPGKVSADPVVTDELLFVGVIVDVGTASSTALFLALDRETGAERWRYEIRDSLIWSSPAIGDRVVYIGTGLSEEHGALHAIHIATGQLLWEFPTDAIVGASPVVTDDLVVFGSEDGNLYAVDALTGAEVWARQTSDANRSAPAVMDGVVYVASDNGTLYARDLRTGEIRWEFATGGGAHWPVAVADGLAFIDSFENGTLFAVDTATGTERWRFMTGGSPNSRGVAVSEGVVYVFVGDIIALDAASGEVLWSAVLSVYPSTTPVIAQGIIYFGSQANAVVAFDTATQSERWQFTVEDRVSVDPQELDSVVYVCGENGLIMALWTPPS